MATQYKQQAFATAPNSQADSMLLQRLPLEIRLAIYSQLFSSTRLTWGTRPIDANDVVRLKPALHALAILHVCRKMNQEIGDTWISQVLFNFEDHATMLDKLTTMPTKSLGQIRHLRVFGAGDLLIMNERTGTFPCGFTSTLRLVSGLCLDVFTILSRQAGPREHKYITSLVREGLGWKELRYISNSGIRLDSEITSALAWEAQQPKTWRQELQERDGAASRSTVNVYRSVMSDYPGFELNPESRVETSEHFYQARGGRRYFCIEDEQDFINCGVRGQEITVVIKRGAGVDCKVKHNSPPLLTEPDIREVFPGKKWDSLRDQVLNILGTEDIGHLPFIHDVYGDVRHYKWL